MSTNTVEPPASPAVRAHARHGASSARAAAAVLSPVVVALAALAIHRTLPNEQLIPLALEGVPTWRHPYPVLLVAVLVFSLGLAALQAVWHFPRAWVRHIAPLIAGATALSCLWDLATLKLDWLQLPFFPGPDAVFTDLLADRKFVIECAWHSLRLLVAGYLAGAVAGLLTGLLIGWFPTFRYWAMPVMKVVGPIPATALIPLVMTIWTDSFPAAVALIGFAVWFPMTILTASGISNVRLSYLDVARTLGAGRLYLIFRVALPAALPNIFVGLFMGLGASFLTLLVAENVGVQAGLGLYLSMQRASMDYAKAYGALIVTAVFFSSLMTLLFVVRDRVLSWQKGVIKW